jgi:hypothetical protein
MSRSALVECKRGIGTMKLLFSTAWESWNWELPIGKSWRAVSGVEFCAPKMHGGRA